MPDRKPTALEKALARMLVGGLQAGVVVWLSWCIGYVWYSDTIRSGRNPTLLDVLAVVGCCVAGLAMILLGFWLLERIAGWVEWALSTPADAEPDHFEAIDESRI